MDLTSEESATDICRVCRSESTPDKPLFHPCLCRGSIKFVHQECLTQWLKYSRKEFCELCNHKYVFTPIYHPDMPKRLPIRDFVLGLALNVLRAFQCWLHYTLVAIAWLGIVPLTACRVHRSLFNGSFGSILKLPMDIISTDSLFTDCLHGIFIMAITLCAFVSLVWLREQIIHGNPLNGNQNQNEPPLVLAEEEANNENPPNPPLVEPQERENDELEAVDQAGPHEENAADENAEGVDEAAPAPADQARDADDNNWQPFEWAPAGGEDLTWERLLGLDGSLLFLEHVFWVISLNALFLTVFAFCPYHVGSASVKLLRLERVVEATHFSRLVTTLFGYLVVAATLYSLQALSSIVKLRKVQKVLSMCYLAVKVFLLVLMEIGIFPLICGFWLDVCSLMLFSASCRDRIQSFKNSPGTSVFVHWLVGMIYVFYFASFVLLLREVLRPGVLWFLRNLNDPEFNPIQEMIQFPMHRHLRRFVASLVMFGLTILFIVYYPIKIVMSMCPTVLPYNIHSASLNSTSSFLNMESSLSELSLELLLLQVVLPALLEQSHARQALKFLIKGWCLAASRIFGLADYLLPAEAAVARQVAEPFDANGNAAGEQGAAPPAAQPAPAPLAAAVPALVGNLGAEHQALLLGGRSASSYQPYRRPTCFALRIVLLLSFLALTGLLASIACLTLPVLIGRQAIYVVVGRQKVHELYTMACGLYLCWLAVRVSFLLAEHLPWGLGAICAAAKFWATAVVKCLAVALAVVGVLPLLLGVLFQLVLVVPLRVAVNQTPLFFHWQDWAMGILHCKILCALIMMGPDWRFKRVFDRIYQDGFRNLNVSYIYAELIMPTVTVVGSIIALPYVTAHSVAPLLGMGPEEEMLLQRHVYPSMLMVSVSVLFICWQFRQLRNLLQRIRNERYLVGQRLVNYERALASSAASHDA